MKVRHCNLRFYLQDHKLLRKMEKKDEMNMPFVASNKEVVELEDVKESVVDLSINNFTRNSSCILF